VEYDRQVLDCHLLGRDIVLPPLDLAAEPLRAMDIPHGALMNFDKLLVICAHHEAAHIKKASHPCNRCTTANSDDEQVVVRKPSTAQLMQRNFLHKLNSLLKEANAVLVGTDIARLNRWIKQSRTTSQGNSANAELNAGQLAAGVSHDTSL
jgi:hypothetical protein